MSNKKHEGVVSLVVKLFSKLFIHALSVLDWFAGKMRLAAGKS